VGSILTSKRLTYIKWQDDDFDALKEILGNPKVCEYLPGNNQKSDDEIRRWLHYYVASFNDAKGNRIYKVLDSEQRVIGYCGLGYVKEFDQIEIMYGLAESAWRNGYGLEMSLRMKELAVELGYDFVIALADINNAASNKILIKTGYHFVRQIELWGADLNYYEQQLS